MSDFGGKADNEGWLSGTVNGIAILPSSLSKNYPNRMPEPPERALEPAMPPMIASP